MAGPTSLQILRGVQTQQRTLVRQSQAQAAAAATYFDACGAGVPAHEAPAEQVGALAVPSLQRASYPSLKTQGAVNLRKWAAVSLANWRIQVMQPLHLVRKTCIRNRA